MTTSPEGGETPATTKPLDAQRARLRAAGLTDDEISKIIVARALGVQSQHEGASAGAHGEGAMSGTLSNFNAVMTYARGIIPTVANQIMTVRDSSAAASVRLAAFLSLLVKAALLTTFCYVVSLEFSQLRSATDRARSEAYIKQTEAEAADGGAARAATADLLAPLFRTPPGEEPLPQK